MDGTVVDARFGWAALADARPGRLFGAVLGTRQRRPVLTPDAGYGAAYFGWFRALGRMAPPGRANLVLPALWLRDGLVLMPACHVPLASERPVWVAAPAPRHRLHLAHLGLSGGPSPGSVRPGYASAGCPEADAPHPPSGSRCAHCAPSTVTDALELHGGPFSRVERELSDGLRELERDLLGQLAHLETDHHGPTEDPRTGQLVLRTRTALGWDVASREQLPGGHRRSGPIVLHVTTIIRSPGRHDAPSATASGADPTSPDGGVG